MLKCNTCGRTLPLSDFWKNNKNKKHGRRTKCIECCKEYAKKYNPKYWQSEASREADRRRNQTPERKQELAAHAAVRYAITTGKLTVPDQCEYEGCQESHKLQAHHYNGYTHENYLKVAYVCQSHHIEVEKDPSKMSNVRLTNEI